MRKSNRKIYNLRTRKQSMEIRYGQQFISELSQGITHKFATAMTVIEPLLPVDDLYAIKGGYC